MAHCKPKTCPRHEGFLTHGLRRLHAYSQEVLKLCLHIAQWAKVFDVKSFSSLQEYIDAAVSTARFEKIEGGQKIYAQLPAFKGVWAQGRTRREVEKELREALSGWIQLQVERGYELPSIKGATPKELTFA
jgi:predicted RNase H-like HicB family nuclease